MKIRTDFVTNSSSSSFVAYAVYSDELSDFIQEMIDSGELINNEKGWDSYYGVTPCSYLKIIDCGVSITVQLSELSSRSGKDFNLSRNQYEEDERSMRQKYEDNKKALNIGYLHSAVSHFFNGLHPDSPLFVPSEKDVELDRILEKALSDNKVRARTFMESTDGFIGSETFDGYEPPVSFWIDNGVLYKYEEQPGVTSAFIPLNVKKIGANSFHNAKKLAQVRIPDTVNTIGNGAFQNCSSLRIVELPDTIHEIPSNAFHDCTALESIDLSDSVRSIGDKAFMGCTNLKTIKADSLTSIGKDAFKNCDSLIAVPTIKEADDQQNGLLSGKIIVHTGLTKEEEDNLDANIIAAGGVVKSSVVLNTDYVVYNPEYDHETVKLKRAKELIATGKNIKVLTIDEFYKLINAEKKTEIKETQEDVTFYTTIDELKKYIMPLIREAKSVLECGGKVTIECELVYGISSDFKDKMSKVEKELSTVGIVEDGPTEGSKRGFMVLAPIKKRQ